MSTLGFGDWLKNYAIALVIILCFAILITLNPINWNPDHPNSNKFETALACYDLNSDCNVAENFAPTGLPLYIPRTTGDGDHTLSVQLDISNFDQSEIEKEIIGIFLPKFSNSLDVLVNGQSIAPFITKRKNPSENRIHFRHRSFYTTFNKGLLNDKDNQLEIILSGYRYQPLSLFQVYMGDSLTLRIRYTMRQFLRISLVEISIGFVSLTSLLMLSLWLSRRDKQEYLWISLAGFTCLIPLVGHLVPSPLIPDHSWSRLYAISIQLVCYFVFRYTAAHFLNLSKAKHTWLVCANLVFVLAILLVPIESFIWAIGAQQIATAIFVVCIPAICLKHAKNKIKLGLAHTLLFSFVCAMLALELYYGMFGPTVTAFQPAYLAPLVLFFGATCLVFVEFSRSLKRLETVNEEMELTIIEKSSELAKLEREKALIEERKRITFDLHDGVGGQLASALAYLEASDEKDEYLLENLQRARSDINLVMDTLSEKQSLSSLLAMFRTRIEPLLERTGIHLNWKAFDSPFENLQNPEFNIQVIRIVNEAFLNVVKHSNASQITLKTAKSEIVIQDNGNGNSASQKEHNNGGGIGINGMKSRAKNIALDLSVRSNANGTHVSLSNPE